MALGAAPEIRRLVVSRWRSKHGMTPLRKGVVRKIEDYGGGWYGHWMRITEPKELDDELLGWLRESYRQMGMQERLAGR